MSAVTERLSAALADRYRIERELGQGGMATVYLAQDLKHDRRVALKVLRPELTPALGAERFLKEIRVTAALQHPNILPLYDSGQADQFLYYVMPYLEGESLRDRLDREKQIGVTETIALIQAVAAGLHHAHTLHVIHRDIKPGNILFYGAHSVIADFGIALSVGEATRLTETGLSIGTPYYMSPEQASGERDVGVRSDIYALACVTYEMLAGEPPFTGPNAQAIVAKHLVQTPASISAVRRSVPAALDTVLAQALAKSPADRFATMEEFAAAVTAAAVAPAGMVTTTRSSDYRSIAVLPFVNLGGSADDEYFSDGMTDEIISALARLPGLKVIARTSVFAFKGRNADVREVADALGVRMVLEGTVRRAGQRVRVTVQLIDGAEGTHKWSNRFDGAVDDVFALQDDIARRIAERFEVAGSPSQPLVPEHTADIRAYDHYLRGRFAWERLDMPGALTQFGQALRVDPDYALAHVGVAMAHNLSNSIGAVPPAQSGPPAEAAVKRALAIDPGLAEAYAELAWSEMAYRWNWDAAYQAAQRALELDPGYYNAHRVHALILGFVQGRFDEALDAYARAHELDPLNPILVLDRGFLLAATGRYQEVADLIEPVVDEPRITAITWYILALSYALLGRLDAAARLRDRVLDAARTVPNFASMAHTITAYIEPVARPDAYRQTVALAESHYVQPVMVAHVAAGCGYMDEAYTWLERARAEGDGIMWLFRYHPASLPLQADPRFQPFIDRVGFPPPRPTAAT